MWRRPLPKIQDKAVVSPEVWVWVYSCEDSLSSLIQKLVISVRYPQFMSQTSDLSGLLSCKTAIWTDERKKCHRMQKQLPEKCLRSSCKFMFSSYELLRGGQLFGLVRQNNVVSEWTHWVNLSLVGWISESSVLIFTVKSDLLFVVDERFLENNQLKITEHCPDLMGGVLGDKSQWAH